MSTQKLAEFQRYKSIFNDPTDLIFGSTDRPSHETPVEKRLADGLQRKLKRIVSDVECWVVEPRTSQTMVYRAMGEPYQDSTNRPSPGKLKSQDVENLYVRSFVDDGQMFVGIGKRDDLEIWIKFAARTPGSLADIEYVETFISALNKIYNLTHAMYSLAKGREVDRVENLIKENFSRKKDLVPAFEKLDSANNSDVFLINSSTRLMEQLVRQFLKSLSNDYFRYVDTNKPKRNTKAPLPKLFADRDPNKSELGSFFQWVTGAYDLEDVTRYLSQSPVDGEYPGKEKHQFMISCVPPKILSQLLGSESNDHRRVLDHWLDHVLPDVKKGDVLSRETLVLWFCRKVFENLVSSTSDDGATQSRTANLTVVDSVCYISREIRRKHCFEQLEIGFVTQPLVIAEKLINLIQFYVNESLGLFIPLPLWNKLPKFLTTGKSHEHQRLAELFQHGIDTFLLGLFLSFQEYGVDDNYENGHEVSLADYLNRQSDKSLNFDSGLNKEFLQIFTLSALFHDLGMEERLLEGSESQESRLNQLIESFKERAFIDVQESQLIKQTYNHKKHQHVVVSATVCLQELERSNNMVPRQYKVSEEVIRKTIRAILFHAFTCIRPRSRQENDPALVLLVFCDAVCSWHPSMTMLNKHDRRFYGEMEFSLPIEATSSQFNSVRWSFGTLSEEPRRPVFEVEFSRSVDHVRATLSLVQMLGRLKHEQEWCPEFWIKLGKKRADRFLKEIEEDIRGNEPQIYPFVRDWIANIDGANTRVKGSKANYLRLQGGTSYFGKLDIDDFLAVSDNQKR